jgi:hypothetical protein
VVKKQGKKKATAPLPVIGRGTPKVKGAGQPAKQQPRGKKTTPVPKPPKTEAVIIGRVAEGLTAAGVLKRAKEGVDLKALGVTVKATRLTRTGDLLLEVGTKDEAEKLAGSLQATVGNTAAICRPQVIQELLLLGVDPTVDAGEIATAVTSAVGGDAATGPLKVTLQQSRDGTQSARLLLPVAEACTLAAAGRLQLGWTKARVRVPGKRPQRCYRCHLTGHLAAACRGEDRSLLCYNCGGQGHVAATCPNAAHCQTCAKAGKSAKHRFGTASCPASLPLKGGSRKRGARPR